MSDFTLEGLFGQYGFREDIESAEDRARELIIKSQLLMADAEAMKEKAFKLDPKLKERLSNDKT